MSYKKSDDNFAQFQLGEGFGSAVTGKKDELSIKNAASIGKRNMNALPAGLQGLPAGYEGYSSDLADYDEYGESDSSISNAPTGLQGFEGASNIKSENFGDVADDAFAGYTTEKGLSDADVDESPNPNNYGVLAESPTESFHTIFHQASLANSEADLTRLLAKAVKAVSADTPNSIRKEYHGLIKSMLKRKKTSNIQSLDIHRVEVEANIDRLINPKTRLGDVPLAMLPSEQKEDRQMALGRQLKNTLRASDPQKLVKGLGGFGELSPTFTYLGIGLLGLIIAGIAHYYLKKPKITTAMKKRKRK